MDIVALRPEVELCYMGIANKCFEILENRRSSGGGASDWGDGRPESHLGLHGGMLAAEEDGASDGDVDEGLDVDDEEADEGVDEELDDTESEDDHDDDDDDDDDDSSDLDDTIDGRAARLRLREILFYDDKVAIFKARHGRL